MKGNWQGGENVFLKGKVLHIVGGRGCREYEECRMEGARRIDVGGGSLLLDATGVVYCCWCPLFLLWFLALCPEGLPSPQW